MTDADDIALFEQAAATFRSVLSEVRPEQHHRPTPCAPLDVAELVVKAIGHQDWVKRAIQGESAAPSYPPVEPDAWIGAFDESTASMVAELRSEGVMERRVTLAAGIALPGSDIAAIAARNIFQFAWDLSVATDHNLDLAPELADQLLSISRTRLVPQRGPGGFFGPEFVPAPGAPVATVLAGFLGREV